MSRAFFPSPLNICRAMLFLSVVQLSACGSYEERAKSYYQHGLQLLAAHDYRRAEIELRNAVKYDKNLLPAWQGLAKAAELAHDWNNLLPALHNILALDPKDVAARVKLGQLLLAGGDFDEALQFVNDAKEADKHADLLALKAALLLKLNDASGAVTEAQAALKIDPDDADASLVLATDRFNRGDTKGALEILNSKPVTQRSGTAVDIFKLRIFEKTQDLQQAEALLKKLIGANPKQIAFEKELIRLYLSQHRDADAEKEQRAIVAADPTNVETELDLIRLLQTIKGPVAARQELVALINAGGNTFPYQLLLAQLALVQGNSSEGIGLLKKLVSSESSPDHVLTAQVTLAETYLSLGQTTEAEPIVSDILSKDSRDTRGLKLRASIRMDRGQVEDAIADLRQALGDQPQATDLMLMLAIAYERSGSIDLAKNEFADAMRVSNFDPTVSLNYVAFLRRRGNISSAEDVLADLASRWPKNVQILSALAQVKLLNHEWNGAQELAETIRSIDSNPIMADELLGAALAGQNKYDESIAAFQHAQAASPPSAQLMYALVRTYLRAGKKDRAVSFLQEVLKADPANAEAYVLLGSVQLASKSLEQARQSFSMAIEKQPENAMGYKALSDFYLAQGNNSEALEVLRDGLKKQPGSIALHFGLAGIFERTGDYGAAISEYETLFKKDPGSIVVINNLASLLADQRTDQASLDRARTLAATLQDSPLPQFKDTLGWVSYREGDYGMALPLLEDAAAALPQIALVHYHLGMAYVASGQSGKASDEFRLALEQAPDHELAQKIHAALRKIGTQ